MGILEMNFIRSYVEIRNLIERFAHFVNEQFQYLHPFGRLHVVPESADKSGAMTGHVYLRYEQYVMPFTEIG